MRDLWATSWGTQKNLVVTEKKKLNEKKLALVEKKLSENYLEKKTVITFPYEREAT